MKPCMKTYFLKKIEVYKARVAKCGDSPDEKKRKVFYEGLITQLKAMIKQDSIDEHVS